MVYAPRGTCGYPHSFPSQARDTSGPLLALFPSLDRPSSAPGKSPSVLAGENLNRHIQLPLPDFLGLFCTGSESHSLLFYFVRGLEKPVLGVQILLHGVRSPVNSVSLFLPLSYSYMVVDPFFRSTLKEPSLAG